MKYQFSADHQQAYAVTVMCGVLEVSVSGYSAWRKREPSQHSREDAQLAEKVNTAFQSNRRVYGSPRIHAELHAQGIPCARKRVARLMRELGLSARRPGHRTTTTHSEKGAQVATNVLQQDLSAAHPNQKWTADTTYIWTQEGWLYLAVVLDLFSRMVARLGDGGHPGCDIGRTRQAVGSGSSLSTSGSTPPFGSWQHL
jgi:putative transposase